MIARPKSGALFEALERCRTAEQRVVTLGNVAGMHPRHTPPRAQAPDIERRITRAECAAVEHHDEYESLTKRWARWNARGA